MRNIQFQRFDRLNLLALLLLLGIVPAIGAPLLGRGIRGNATIVPQSDFPTHSVLAAKLRMQRQLIIPHPFYHLVLMGVQRGVELFHGSHQSAAAKAALADPHSEVQGELLVEISNQYSTAAIITTVFFVWWLSWILWGQIRVAANIQTVGGVFAGVAVVIGLILLAPIALFHAQDSRYYFGYIGINVWHNPTVIAAKPFAILTFLATLAGFPDQSETTRRRPTAGLCALAAVVVLGATVKPSFLMCLVPAVFTVAIYRQFRSGQQVRWIYLLMGLILPTVLMLGWQSRIYSHYTGGSRPIFSPLLTMSALSQHLAPKLLLSIVFPVACYLAWWKEACASFRLNLAWLAFIVGILFTYLIAETQRATHGNFLWGAQLALFLLFVESSLFSVKRVRDCQLAPARTKADTARAAVCMLAFTLHVVSGVIYCAHLFSRHRGNSWLKSYWWYH